MKTASIGNVMASAQQRKPGSVAKASGIVAMAAASACGENNDVAAAYAPRRRKSASIGKMK